MNQVSDLFVSHLTWNDIANMVGNKYLIGSFKSLVRPRPGGSNLKYKVIYLLRVKTRQQH